MSRYLLTTDNHIEVQGPQTSAEIEIVAFIKDDQPAWITVGSDHNDRPTEYQSYNKPKQLCPKIHCPTVWPYDEVKNHWDQLTLQLTATIDGKPLGSDAGFLLHG